MRAVRAAALSLLVAGMLAGGGCYKPTILPGTLQCSIPDDKCPDDWTCDKSNPQLHLCVRSGGGGRGGATGGTQGTGGKGGSGKGGNGTGGTAGAGGMGGKPGTGGAAGAACLAKVSSCTTTFDGGACDPVCNVGCASCDEKCSVNSIGTRTCNAPVGAPAATLSPCYVTQNGADLSTQTDNCGPGEVCIEPTTCGTLCYQFCRTNLDCPSQNCGHEVGNGLKVCDAPFTNCDPTLRSQCGAGSLTACYISQENGKTMCDCPNNVPLGTAKDKCTESRDCNPGLVCYNATGRIGDSQCRRVCKLPTDGGASDGTASTCAGGAANCMPMRLSSGMVTTTWGYCNE